MQSLTNLVLGNSATSLQSMLSGCSLNKAKLTSSSSAVAPLVQLACSGKIYGNSWTASACKSSDYVGWADAADLATLANADIDPNSYKYM